MLSRLGAKRMSDPATFLLARLDEDEEWTRFVLSDIADDKWWWTTDGITPEGEKVTAYHPASHGPRRILVDVQAKRAIVRAYVLNRESGNDLGMRWTILQLAAVYADHPDFDEAWRP
jgi:hypothetical protein